MNVSVSFLGMMAFDSMPHDLIRAKFEAYGIIQEKNEINNIVLTNRTQWSSIGK